jgi:hypothetical protein
MAGSLELEISNLLFRYSSIGGDEDGVLEQRNYCRRSDPSIPPA